MPLLEVQGLYKIFGPQPERVFPLLERGVSKAEILKKTGCTVGINNASFDVEQRQTFVIMGLSGSGKSTVIRCLNRLIMPTRGKILVGGQDLIEMDRNELLEVRRSKMSMVFQNFGLLPHRTVLGNVEYGLEISGVDRVARRKKSFEALEVVGLKGYEQSRPDQLSGGMQQRVGLARALANDPEILLMDEAFSALDPLIRTQMQDELLQLQSRLHKTIVFITHDLDEALKLGERIAIMKDGEVVQIGTSEEILTHPANDYVKAFVQNVDRTKVITAAAIMRKAPTIILPRDGPRVAVRAMERSGTSTVYVLDSDRRLLGILRIDNALKMEKEHRRDVETELIHEVFVARRETVIADLLNTALKTRFPLAVVDTEDRFIGIVDRATIMGEVLSDPTGETAPIPLGEFQAKTNGSAATEEASS